MSKFEWSAEENNENLRPNINTPCCDLNLLPAKWIQDALEIVQPDLSLNASNKLYVTE
jgi:hypothetical protein